MLKKILWLLVAICFLSTLSADVVIKNSSSMEAMVRMRPEVGVVDLTQVFFLLPGEEASVRVIPITYECYIVFIRSTSGASRYSSYNTTLSLADGAVVDIAAACGLRTQPVCIQVEGAER